MASMSSGGASAATLSEFNRSQIMRVLYRSEVCSRAHIARELGLTPASITQIVAQLIELGLVRESGNLKGRARSRAIGVAIAADRFRVLAVKFGRGRTEAGVFDLSGVLAYKTHEYIHWDYELDADSSEIIASLKNWIESHLLSDPSIVAIGMAVPGPYLRDEGRMADIVPGVWNGVNFIDEFRAAFNVPVFIEQDARAGVLAQYMFSSIGGKEKGLAYMLLGEGVGIGVMEGDVIINGVSGLATEIGHMSIDVHGRACPCGGVGCLEQYCSMHAMLEQVADDMPELLKGLDPRERSYRRSICLKVFELADQGDVRAGKIVDDIAVYVGHACVMAINAYDPGVVVLGDVMVHGGRRLLERVRAVVSTYGMRGVSGVTRIILNELPIDPVLCGAAAVAIQAFLDKPTRFAELRMAAEGRRHRI